MANVDRELVSAVEEALKLNAKSVSDTRIVKSTSGVTSIPVVNESGEVVRVPMDIMRAKTVLFKDINSLTDPYTSCGEYIVTDGITILGIMTVTTQWSPHTIYQKITTTATLEGLNSMEGLEVPTMSYIGLNDYVRYYNITNKTWSVWQEYNFKLDDSVITSWDGTIVENPTINSQSSTANGKVVLAKMNNKTMGFVWEVTAGNGTKSYYNNWIEGSNYSGFSNYQDTPFDGTKQVEIKRTIFITPENGTYLCLNGREVTNIDSLENIAKSVKWSGEIVNGVTISQNSYTGDDGAVVLVGNYTFAYKVGSTYYGNWTTREDYQKNIYKSGTIGWKAGFYDYLLYVSPTSVWMKKSDSELVNISSEGSGGGSDALLLGDINSLTDSSTSSQIATALNNKTLVELQDAVRNGASIQFVGDYGVVDIIHKSQSTGQLVFGFVYTDEPVYAPYMSKIIALEYTNGNWTCKVREDVDLSSGGSGRSDVTLDKLPSNIMYEISGVTSTSGYSIKSNYKNPSTGGLTSSVLAIPTVALNRAGIMTTDMYQKMVNNQSFQFEYQNFDTDFSVGQIILVSLILMSIQ